MKLCIPFSKENKTFINCEVKKPKPGDIADAQEAFTEQTEFHGILKILSAGIDLLEDSKGKTVDNKYEIESICRFMPYQTAEQVALNIMVLLNKDDKIEAEFICPRCGKKGYSDGEDSIKDIPIHILEQLGSVLLYEFESVQIKARDGSIIEDVNRIEMRYPNINDCISAALVIPVTKSARRQYEIYSNAILKINDKEVDLKWKKTWGRYLLEKVDFDVMESIGNDMKMYGLVKTIDRVCIQCGKEWKSPISTANFFESGLRGM